MSAAYAGLGHLDERFFADGVGYRFEVVEAYARASRGAAQLAPDDFPAPRRGQPRGVLTAEVVAVRFVDGGERPDDGLLLGVDIGQRRDGSIATRGARTAASLAHGRDSSSRGRARPPPTACRRYAANVEPKPQSELRRKLRRRRDRRGRGLRGRLVPPQLPLSRRPSEQFDDLVLDAVEHLDSRWQDQLAALEFAVEDVPPVELLMDEHGQPAVPLAKLVPAGTDSRGHAYPPRIVIFRRPIEARARRPLELADLVHDLVVEEVARFLGLDPDVVDPPPPGSDEG